METPADHDREQLRAQRRARIADLRSNPRIQALIAARRAEYTLSGVQDMQDPAERFMPAPIRPFGLANGTNRYGDGRAWYEPWTYEDTVKLIGLRPLLVLYPSGNAKMEDEAVVLDPMPLRTRMTAIYRALRLAKHDKGDLLRELAGFRRRDNAILMRELLAALRRDNAALKEELKKQDAAWKKKWRDEVTLGALHRRATAAERDAEIWKNTAKSLCAKVSQLEALLSMVGEAESETSPAVGESSTSPVPVTAATPAVQV